MRKFIIIILLFFGIPVVGLLGLYIWTDPFRCVHAFDIENTDATNREYLSTELYLLNKDSVNYDSFVFSSSRGCGINTYTWKTYPDSTAHPFLFQAWSETLMGEYLKMKYLDETGMDIKNAIILLDIPGSFMSTQLSHDALDMKHYIFTGGSRWSYNAWQFFNYLQKPSGWVKSLRKRNVRIPYCADRITNDWDADNKENYRELPIQDSMRNCSATTIQTMLTEIVGKTDDDVVVSVPLITEDMNQTLYNMKSILDKHGTNYVVILSPAICYNHPSVNPLDLEKLQTVFGMDKVYNYTGANDLTRDTNNFLDPGHFGRRVGYIMMKEIYKKKE